MHLVPRRCRCDSLPVTRNSGMSLSLIGPQITAEECGIASRSRNRDSIPNSALDLFRRSRGDSAEIENPTNRGRESVTNLELNFFYCCCYFARDFTARSEEVSIFASDKRPGTSEPRLEKTNSLPTHMPGFRFFSYRKPGSCFGGVGRGKVEKKGKTYVVKHGDPVLPAGNGLVTAGVGGGGGHICVIAHLGTRQRSLDRAGLRPGKSSAGELHNAFGGGESPGVTGAGAGAIEKVLFRGFRCCEPAVGSRISLD